MTNGNLENKIVKFNEKSKKKLGMKMKVMQIHQIVIGSYRVVFALYQFLYEIDASS